MLTRRKIYISLIVCLLLGVFFYVNPTWAQYGEEYGNNIELGDTNPMDLVVNIINWTLGILALIATCIVLWGGFIWMFSGGDPEKLDKAKKILRNGVIGLVIILSAWGIAWFILSQILDWTGADDITGEGCTVDCGETGGTCPFYVDTSVPSDGNTDVSLCTSLYVEFNLPINEAESSINNQNFIVTLTGTVDDEGNVTATLRRGNGQTCSEHTDCKSSVCDEGTSLCEGNTMPGTFAFDPDDADPNYSWFEFIPSIDYQPNSVYSVDIDDSRSDFDGVDDAGVAQDLCCTNGKCDYDFITGTTTDIIPPTVDVSYSVTPEDGSTDYGLNCLVRAIFSEGLRRSSLKDENVWMYNIDGTCGDDSLCAGGYNDGNSCSGDSDCQALGICDGGTCAGGYLDGNDCDSDEDCYVADELDVQSIGVMTMVDAHGLDTLYTYPEETLTPYSTYGINLYSGDVSSTCVSNICSGGDNDGEACTLDSECWDFADAITDTCGNPLDGDYDGTAEGSTTDDFIDPLSEANNQGADEIYAYPWHFTTGEQPVCIPVIEEYDPDEVYYSKDNADIDTGEYNTSGTEDSDIVTYGGIYLDQFTDIYYHSGISAVNSDSCFDEDFNTSDGLSCMVDFGFDTLQVRTPIGARDGHTTIESNDGNGSTYDCCEADASCCDGINIKSPVITYLSPAYGPPLQAITIKGENFGDDRTADFDRVYFINTTWGIQAEALYPCDDGWDDDQIIVQVPEELWPEGVAYEDLVTTDFNIQILNYVGDDLTYPTYYSNFKDFELNEGEPGPTLCTLDPSCSYSGDESDSGIATTGENYGTSEGSSIFYDIAAQTPYTAIIKSGTWIADTDPNTATIENIPDEASGEGAYNVILKDANGNSSNGLDFNIPCADAPSVLVRGNCDPDGNIYPSPNPQNKEEEACRNGAVVIAFDPNSETRKMDPSTFSTDNIRIFECNDGYVDDAFAAYDSELCGTDNMTDDGGVTFNGGYETGDEYKGAYIENMSFQAGYWYKGEATTGIASTDLDGANTIYMTESYTWYFRVRAEDEDCIADLLDLTPSYAFFNQFNHPFEEDDAEVAYQTSWADFFAAPYTAECLPLNSMATDWTITDEAGGTPDPSLPDPSAAVANFNKYYYPSLAHADYDESTANGENDIWMMGEAADNAGLVFLTALVDGGATDNSHVTVDFGYCEDDEDCSDRCLGSTCDLNSHRCMPIINSISPDDGGAESCITISGCFFGTDQGDDSAVNFVDVHDNLFTATYPTATGCEDVWDDDEIVAKVPATGLALGVTYDVKLTSTYNLEVTEADAYEYTPENRPCLCNIEPNYGDPESDVILYGENFGTGAVHSAASFYGSPTREDATINSWAEELIEAEVPVDALSGVASNLGSCTLNICVGGANHDGACDDDSDCPGNEGVYVENELGIDSNSKDFYASCNTHTDCGSGCCSEGLCADVTVCNACYDKEDCTDEYRGCYGDCVDSQCTPYITSIDPASGDTGQAVTVEGCNLGTTGQAWFDEQEADILCGQAWTNIEIILETPDSSIWSADDNQATVYVSRDDEPADGVGDVDSNTKNYNLNNSCADYDIPILCELDPEAETYEQAVVFFGYNYTEIGSEYCVCRNPDDQTEDCQVEMIDLTQTQCDYTEECSLGYTCNDNKDTWDETLDGGNGACLCTNQVDTDETCEVLDGEMTCEYTYTCTLDEVCTVDHEDYFSVGGFLTYPGFGRISDDDYTAGIHTAPEPDNVVTSVPEEGTDITSGDAYVGVEDTDGTNQCYSNSNEFSLICSSCDEVPEGQHCDFSYFDIGDGAPDMDEDGDADGRATGDPLGYCQDYPESCCGNTGCVVGTYNYDYCTCDDGFGNSCEISTGDSSCIVELTGDECSLDCTAESGNQDTYEAGECIDLPYVTATEPENGETDVCLNAALTVTFSEPMMPSDEAVDDDGDYDFSGLFALRERTPPWTDVESVIETNDNKTFTIRYYDNNTETYLPLAGDTQYEIQIYSDLDDSSGIVSQSAGLAIAEHDDLEQAAGYQYLRFRTMATTEACPVDEVEITAASSDFAEIDYYLTYAGETQGLNATAYYNEVDTCECYEATAQEYCDVDMGADYCTTDSGVDCYLDDEDEDGNPDTCGEDYSDFDDNKQALTSIEDFFSWEWTWDPTFTTEMLDEDDCSLAGIDKSADDYEEDKNYQTVIAGETDGDVVNIEATASATYGWEGDVLGTQVVTVFFCDADYIWTYSSTRFRFQSAYCRGDAETAYEDVLPYFSKPARIIGGDSLLELIFTFMKDDDITCASGACRWGLNHGLECSEDSDCLVSGNEDAFGLRVYANNIEEVDVDGTVNTQLEDALSPAMWYQFYFDETAGGGETTIDGFPTLEVGRTTYTAAVTQRSAAALIYPNIFLLSYNQDAEEDTVNIMNQIKDNMIFASNIDNGCGRDDSDKQKIIRDATRIASLGEIIYKLDEYYYDEGAAATYPDLSAGTYIPEWTTSKWPSWQATLAGELGIALDTDPYNQFYDSEDETAPCPSEGTCPGTKCTGGVLDGDTCLADEDCVTAHEADTCWDSVVKDFYMPDDTAAHIFMYQGTDDHTGYTLYANFEYTDANWNGYTWSTISDPCTESCPHGTCLAGPDTGDSCGPSNPCAHEYSTYGCDNFNYQYNSGTLNYYDVFNP